MKPRPLYLLPAIGWFIIVTVLLTLPGSAFPKEDWLSKIWFDKWVHIGLFAILVITWNWGLQKLVRKRALLIPFFWIAMAAFAYGIAMEYVQLYFIPNRSFDTGDIIADGIGSAAGFIFSRVRYIKK